MCVNTPAGCEDNRHEARSHQNTFQNALKWWAMSGLMSKGALAGLSSPQIESDTPNYWSTPERACLLCLHYPHSQCRQRQKTAHAPMSIGDTKKPEPQATTYERLQDSGSNLTTAGSGASCISSC